MKTVNVVMLPTEKASRIALLHHFDRELAYKQESFKSPHTSQHLHLTSNDEIKEGDWFQLNNCRPVQCILKDFPQGDPNCKKIIASTDKSLLYICNHCGKYKHNHSGLCAGCGKFGTKEIIGIPLIPESFIQAYIKAYNEGKPITEVQVEEEILGQGMFGGTKPSTTYKLKLRPDNTVIIHQAKLYTREEAKALFNQYRNKLRAVLSLGVPLDWHSEWIDENL